MLSSITPLGERGRSNRFAVTAAWFVAGSLLGGVLSGTVAGAVGAVAVPDAPVAIGIALAAAALAGAAFDAHVGGLRLPTIRRQVDERWINRYRGWVYGAGFGVQLGTGLATIVSSAAVYVMLVAALLTRSVIGGLVIGAVFGAVRGLSLLPARTLDTADGLRVFHRRLAAAEPRGVRAAVALQGAMGVAALVATAVVR